MTKNDQKKPVQLSVKTKMNEKELIVSMGVMKKLLAKS